jgi:hypothetical protein
MHGGTDSEYTVLFIRFSCRHLPNIAAEKFSEISEEKQICESLRKKDQIPGDAVLSLARNNQSAAYEESRVNDIHRL